MAKLCPCGAVSTEVPAMYYFNSIDNRGRGAEKLLDQHRHEQHDIVASKP